MNARASGSRLITEATPSWQLEEADDPEDWEESFSFLKELDATLRCDVCYNIFTAPVSVRNCNHIFCSACIRSAINQPDPVGKHCPKCMEKDVYDSSLTAQPLIERTAEAWKVARSALVKKQKEEKEGKRAAQISPQVSQRGIKRSRTDSREQGAEVSAPRRSMRATSSRVSKVQQEESITIDSDSDQDGMYGPQEDDERGRSGATNGRSQKEDKDYRSLQASDLAECPLCSRKVTLVVLNQHLDKGCQVSDSINQSPSNGLGTSKWFKRPEKASVTKPRRRLARPNYFEMKPHVIKQLLDEAGLSKAGSRENQTERHRQWVTLYNANLDASEKKQKSDAQLRKELEEWEKGQEQSQKRARKLNEEASRTYMQNNEDHFRALLKTARESHMKNKEAHQKKKLEETNGSTDVDTEEEVTNTSSPQITLESDITSTL